MEETVAQRYLGLLNQKSMAVNRILELTQQAHFTGEEACFEEESERFATLYENREAIIAHINAIDATLDTAEYDSITNAEQVDPTHKQVMERIKSTAVEIVKLDKQNIAASEKLSSFLKGNLKQIREGRGASNKYTDVYENTSGFLFDTKK